MFLLKLRMWMLVMVLFSIVYAVITMIGTAMGLNNFYFYLWIALAMMLLQYMIGPKIIEWTMGVRYIERPDNPQLYAIVEDQAARARIPMPRVGVASMAVPNAFAFGRSLRDGRVCVTQGIMRLLTADELKAVIGHEITHLKNRDVLTITILSVIPMIMYRIAWHFLFFGGRRNDRGSQTALVGLVALIFYFVTNLLVLYASRIREYFADRGSVELGNSPDTMATALYKLVYGSARMDKDSIKDAEGLKAFFLNDPSRSLNEIRELSQLDLDRSGTIDPGELATLRDKKINLSTADHLLELMSTHPNMLKRIKRLSEWQRV